MEEEVIDQPEKPEDWYEAVKAKNQRLFHRLVVFYLVAVLFFAVSQFRLFSIFTILFQAAISAVSIGLLGSMTGFVLNVIRYDRSVSYMDSLPRAILISCIVYCLIFAGIGLVRVLKMYLFIS